MKRLVNIILFGVTLFFLNGCGGSSSPTTSVGLEVNGPGGAFVGATEFSYPMIKCQWFYTFNEADNQWIRVVYNKYNQLIYEILDGREVGGTYSIEDGIIIVNDDDLNPIMVLDTAKVTVWEVTGTDNLGKLWQDNWYLELKLTLEMVVGKRFSSQFEKDGVVVNEEYAFTDTTVKVFNSDGALLGEFPYSAKEGRLYVIEDTKEFTLNLMSIEENGNFNIWYSSEVRSGSSVWSL